MNIKISMIKYYITFPHNHLKFCIWKQIIYHEEYEYIKISMIEYYITFPHYHLKFYVWKQNIIKW